MIDTHCHLDSPRFDADREQVLERAAGVGITDLVVPSIGPSTWEPLLDWVARRPRNSVPRVHPALGIHPQLLPDLPPSEDDRHLAQLESLLASGGAIGIGECGLDGPSVPGAAMDRQVAVLAAHLALARSLELPLLLHCLRAHEPLLALLAEAGPVRGVLHSYSGSAEQVRDYLGSGLHFAVAGPVTYERARKPVLAARAIPSDRLVLETDAPDQTPRPHAGRCEPAFLREIALATAQVRGLTPEELDRLTSTNARSLFGLGAASAEPRGV